MAGGASRFLPGHVATPEQARHGAFLAGSHRSAELQHRMVPSRRRWPKALSPGGGGDIEARDQFGDFDRTVS
jgi:hypothetical protein